MRLRRHSLFILCFLTAVFLLCGCATIYNPATGREEVVWISAREEQDVGRKMARQVEKKFKTYNDLFTQSRVNAIGQQLVKFCDRKEIPYHFTVLDSEEINAFALPGGYIYVFRGLIEKAGSDAEIAAVLAHEIGHIAARHPVKKMESSMGYNVLMSLAFAKSETRELTRYIDIGYNIVSLGYSREDEFLADRLSVRYLRRSGYSPGAVVSFLKKLQELNKSQEVPYLVIFRSHPLLTQRIEAAEKEIAGPAEDMAAL
ncbi:MAG: M48 family metallopeptidase [Candidatus Omnitrophota bacterium]